jgi:transcriptional regulator with XRE-family HTH domain
LSRGYAEKIRDKPKEHVSAGSARQRCGFLRILAVVARQLADGQRAAIRVARARRGELGLTQKELARAAGVTVRTVEMFETFRTWPRADTLAQIERLGLNWPVGYLTEYAAKHREHEPSTLDEDIAGILDSNMHPDLKLRLIDRLRSIRAAEIHREAAEMERRLAELSPPGEGDKGQEIA